MLNTHAFLMPKDRHFSAAIPKMDGLFKRGVGALEHVLGGIDYMIGNRFSAIDIIVGYAVNLGRDIGFLGDEFPNRNAYLGRLFDREHCTSGRGRRRRRRVENSQEMSVLR